MLDDEQQTKILSTDVDISEVTENTQSVKSRVKNKKILILFAFVMTLLVLGVGAAAYNEIVLNNPDRIWDQAMQNTVEGLDTLSRQISENPAKGGSVEGSFNVTEPIVVSGAVSGSWYENNGVFKGDVSLSGIKANGEVRLIGSTGEDTTSTTYIKIDGLDSATPLLNLIQPELADVINTINGNWYIIDDSLKSDIVPESEDLQNISLTPEELSQLSEKISNVIKDRLFSIDESRAVVVIDKPLGREDFEYADTYKYAVKIQKQQLTDFVSALQEALKGTQFESLLQGSISTGMNAYDESQIDSLLAQLNSLDTSTIRAEAWVDMDLKYFRNVRIPLSVNDTEMTNYIDFGLDYDGGDIFPFYVQINESATYLSLNTSFNKASKETIFGFSVNSNSDTQKLVANGELKLTPSDKPINVEKPIDAKNASELLGIIGQSNSLDMSGDLYDNLEFNTLQFDDIEL